MWIAVVASLIVLIAVFVATRGRYYKRLFSTESFREFHGSLSRAVELAQHKRPDQPPALEDGTAFVTEAGLAVGVTCTNGDDGHQTLHISLSQRGNVTTHAVCSRFGFFVAAMLGSAKGELTPFYADSGVHHLVFRLQALTIQVQSFDSSYARYLNDYKPVPFRHENLIKEVAKPSGGSATSVDNAGATNGPPSAG